MNPKNISIVGACALVIALGSAFAVVQKAAGHFATAADLQQLSSTVDNLSKDQKRHLLVVRRNDITARIWKLEDRWADLFKAEHGRSHRTLDELRAYMNPVARDSHRSLMLELAETEEEIRKLDQGE